METLSLFLLIAVGLLLLMVELFFVPGTTLVGIAGFGLAIWGIAISFTTFGAVGGTITAISTLVLGLLFAYAGFKSGLWKRFSLHTKLDSTAPLTDITGLQVGDEGQSLSDLRPSGNAIFNGQVYTVVTRGHQVPAGTAIHIIQKEGNRLLVAEL